MSKKFRNIIVLFILLLGITIGAFKVNDKITIGKSSLDDSSIEVSNEKNSSKSNENNNSKDNKNNIKTPKTTVSKDYNSTKDDTTLEDNATSSKSTSNLLNDDYTVVVSSNTYNAFVILDKDNKEINIKLIDEKTANSASSDRYINFTDDEVKYLVSNSNNLLSEFKDGNLLEKYSMVSKMLSEFDTNIKESDLIALGISYLK